MIYLQRLVIEQARASFPYGLTYSGVHPNLRVTARKLLRHAWIVGCRRADANAPVTKTPANFNQAVEEVKHRAVEIENVKDIRELSIAPQNTDGERGVTSVHDVFGEKE